MVFSSFLPCVWTLSLVEFTGNAHFCTENITLTTLFSIVNSCSQDMATVLQFELSTGITGINIFIKKYSCINYHFLYILACNQRCPFFLVLFGFTSRLLLQVFIGSRLVRVPIRLCIFLVFPRVGSKLSYWVKIAITGGVSLGVFFGFFYILFTDHLVYYS
jgi:hypothetical protein